MIVLMLFISFLLIVVLVVNLWIVSMLMSEPGREMARAQSRHVAVPRCSHCGARQGIGVRMLAGRRAYICERCVRRAVDLLDAPEAITRFW